MFKAILNKFLIVIFCVLVFQFANSACAEDGANVLQNIKIKNNADGDIEIQLQTKRLLPSPPLLFEKGKNIYFVSLPATSYNGDKNLNVDKYSSQIKSIKVDFIEYKTAKDNGYTKIVIETTDNTKIKLSNVVTSALGLILLIAGILLGLGLVGGISYFLYRKFNNRNIKKILDVDDVYIEDAQAGTENLPDDEILSYVNEIPDDEVAPIHDSHENFATDSSYEPEETEPSYINEPPETDNIPVETDEVNQADIISDDTTYEDEVISSDKAEHVSNLDILYSDDYQENEANDEDNNFQEDSQPFYPNADEIVNDILQSDETINEISENIKKEVENEDLIESDSFDTDAQNSDDTADNDIQQVQSQDFSAVDAPQISASGVFEMKSMDFTTKQNDIQDVIREDKPEEFEQQDLILEDADDTILDDELFDEEEVNPFDVAGLDGILGGIPSSEDILAEDDIENSENFENIDIEEFLNEESSETAAEPQEAETPVVEDVTVEADEIQTEESSETDAEPQEAETPVVEDATVEADEMQTEKPSEAAVEQQETVAADEIENEIEQVSNEVAEDSNIEYKPEFVVNTDAFFVSNDTNEKTVSVEEYYKPENVVPEIEQQSDAYEAADIDSDAEPVIISEQDISDDKKLYLIKHQGDYSLIGIINEDVFVLNRFEEEPLGKNIVLKLNESNVEQDIYIVKVGKWRALLGVSADSMEHILTLS